LTSPITAHGKLEKEKVEEKMMVNGLIIKARAKGEMDRQAKEARVPRLTSQGSGTRKGSWMQHSSTALTSKVVRYARASMTGGARLGRKRIVPTSRLTSVMSRHHKGMRAGVTTHVVPTSIDNPPPITALRSRVSV
jgi:hypothetical protein